MPSPFPGMDPYLEHPLLWPLFQQYFVGTLADVFGEVLPRRFLAQIKERIYQEHASPGLSDQTSPASCALSAGNPRVFFDHAAGGLHPVWHIPTAPEEVRESYLEIRLAGEPG